MAEDGKYHFERAKAELELALSVRCSDAARSHVRLSSLHLERFKSLGAPLQPAFERA